MRTKLPAQKTRPNKEISESSSDSEAPPNHSSKKHLQNTKEEEKSAQVSNLNAFFGLKPQKSIREIGNAQYEDFPDLSKVKIWHWNVNGINSVCGKGLLQEFFKKADPDMLFLNEIKVDSDKLDKESYTKSIPNCYQQYWNCCKVKKGYAGTAFFTKVQPIEVTFDVGISKHEGEGRVITAEFKEFVVVGTYVPNSGEGLRRLKYRVGEWDKDFQEYLVKLRREKGKPLVLTGDLNVAHHDIDIYDPKGKEKTACFTPQEKASFTQFLSKGYVDTFRHLYPEKQQFSFWSARTNARVVNKGWRLDYFVISQEDLGIVLDSTIHNEYFGSDHCPIQLQINVSKKQAISTPKKGGALSKSKSIVKEESVIKKIETLEIVDNKQSSKKKQSKKKNESDDDEEVKQIEKKIDEIKIIQSPKKIQESEAHHHPTLQLSYDQLKYASKPKAAAKRMAIKQCKTNQNPFVQAAKCEFDKQYGHYDDEF